MGTSNLKVTSVEVEVDFYVNSDGDRLSVFLGGFKAPGANGLNGLFVQPEAERALNADVARASIRADDEVQHHGALILGLARLF